MFPPPLFFRSIEEQLVTESVNGMFQSLWLCWPQETGEGLRRSPQKGSYWVFSNVNASFWVHFGSGCIVFAIKLQGSSFIISPEWWLPCPHLPPDDHLWSHVENTFRPGSLPKLESFSASLIFFFCLTGKQSRTTATSCVISY